MIQDFCRRAWSWRPTDCRRDAPGETLIRGVRVDYRGRVLAPIGRSSDRPVRKGELVPGPPFISDIVDDERAADALDGPLAEAVPRILTRKEDQSVVGQGRRGAQNFPRRGHEIGAPSGSRVVRREVDQHREELCTDIRVRLQPKPFRVLAILDAQKAAAQPGGAASFDPFDAAGFCSVSASSWQTANRLRFSTEKNVRVELWVSRLPAVSAMAGGAKGSARIAAQISSGSTRSSSQWRKGVSISMPVWRLRLNWSRRESMVVGVLLLTVGARPRCGGGEHHRSHCRDIDLDQIFALGRDRSDGAARDGLRRGHFWVARYSISALRSSADLRPVNTILVPGRNLRGSIRY